jgi:diguanylate cyclase (GGDEF)-like protein/PAS domain S-box-containing protein
MHFRQPLGLPVRDEGFEIDRADRGLGQPKVDSSEGPATPRPFVERRRSRRVEQSWPEALDSLHRILLGFENGTKQLTETEGRFREIFEEAPIGIFELNPEGGLVHLNNAMARIFGFDSSIEVMTGDTESAINFFDPAQWNTYASAGDGDVRCFDLQAKTREDKAKWVRCHVREISENGRVLRYEGTAEDVTERKLLEVQTERLAYYDSLTGLPNRTLFRARFEAVLEDETETVREGVLFLFQIDRFKSINDSLGERFGDRLLQEIAERLTRAAGLNSIIARVGGAEFAVVLEGVCDVDGVSLIARRFMDELGAEYSFFGHSLNVFCNLGISVFPKDGTDCDGLIKAADLALGCSREEGINSFRVFSDAMNDKVQEELRIERGLRDALAKNELFLVYQPQVDIRTGCVTGLEALVRWNHPQWGLVLPNQFIPVAESSGLIVPIGEWVLRSACIQARRWQAAGIPPVPVAVNVSAIQFRQQGFGALVRDILHQTGLQPEYLELELTESLLLSNADVMFSTIQELKDMGVMLAIDDFGTGYSSLGYLRQFKVNRLKIARSFIQDVSVDPDDAAITTAIINMAKALKVAVLAEGVENEDQLSFLEAQQCYTIQGFYFSKPVAVDQIDRHLRTGFSQFAPSSIQ